MRKLIYTIAVSALAQCTIHAQVFAWAKHVGSSTSDAGYTVAADAEGNVYVAGNYSNTGDFDPDPEETYYMSSSGSSDVFVVKLDPLGNLIWAKSMGGTSSDACRAIAVDDQGAVFLTGYFSNTADFNPDENDVFNLTSNGQLEVYVVKLDSDGNFGWATSFGGESNDYGFDIAVDNLGSVYATGYFSSSADFGASITLTAVGEIDVFVCKLNSTGDFIYAKSMGGPGYDTGYSVAATSAGEAYIVGNFAGTADFDPDDNTTFNLIAAGLALQGASDIFISKLDSNGNLIWAKRMGGTGFDGAASVVLDADENIYIGGTFSQTADLNPDENQTNNLVSAGGMENFAVKLNAAGNFEWAKRIGGNNADFSISLNVDSDGNVFVTGFFSGTKDFNLNGSIPFNLTATGSTDLFFVRYSTNGDFLWALRMGGSNNVFGLAVALDGYGSALIAGQFNATADFNPEEGMEYSLTSNGGNDAFVVKLSDVNAVGIEENKILDHVQFFPNPTNSFITIQVADPVKSVAIYNLMGELIQTETRSSFSIEHLSTGVYMVLVKTETETTAMRLVKK